MRSMRSRQRITDAMFAYFDEGVLSPTAQQIADRAGVGLRTLFRHFKDMKSLFAEMDQQVMVRVLPILEKADRSGTLEERIASIVALRMEVYDAVGVYIRVTYNNLWRFDDLREQFEATHMASKAEVYLWFPELGEADWDIAVEIEILLSFETWERARQVHDLDRDKTAEFLRNRIAAAMQNTPKSGG